MLAGSTSAARCPCDGPACGTDDAGRSEDESRPARAMGDLAGARETGRKSRSRTSKGIQDKSALKSGQVDKVPPNKTSVYHVYVGSSVC